MKTKLISAPLKILVISFNKDLTQSFLNWIKLNPNFKFEFKIISSLKELNQINLDHYYKALWLISSQEVVTFNKKESADLARINIPLNLSVFYPAQIRLKNKRLDEIKLYQEKLKDLLSWTELNLNQPQIFYGYEAVDPNFYVLAVSSLVFFLKNIESQVLIKPRGKVDYLLINDFFQTLVTFLSKPHHAQKIVVKNSLALKSSEVLSHFERLFSLYYKKELLVKETSLVLENNLTNLSLVNIKSHFNKEVKLLVQGIDPKIEKIKSFLNLLDHLKQKTDLSEDKLETSLEKEVKTSVKKSKKEKKTLHKNSNQQDLESIFNLDKEIIDNLNQTRKTKKEKRLDKDIKLEIKGIKKNKRKKTFFYLGLGLIGVGILSSILIIFYYFNLTLVKNNLNSQLVGILDEKNTSQVVRQRTLDRLLSAQTQIYHQLVDVGLINEANSVLEYQNNLREYLNDQFELKQAGNLVIKTILTGEDISVENLLSSLEVKNKNIINKLNNLINQTDTLALEFNLDTRDVNTLKTRFKNKLKQAVVLDQLIPLFNNLFGKEGQKKYALVYQDNNELRATGGVIESIVILTFNQGKLVGYEVVNANEIDKGVGGKVSPPEEIKKELGEDSWYFADAGWDGVNAGEKIAWFIEKATGQKIDGAILVDNEFLAGLLGLVDGVRLDKYNEFISKKNLDEKLLFYDSLPKEKNQFQKDLLKAIFRQLVSADKLPDLPSVLNSAFVSQHAVLTEFNPNQQEVFNRLLWGGGVLSPSCPSLFKNQVCQIDSLYQVESNIGFNKANYFLTRQIKHRVTLEPKQARHLREIEYHNLAKTDAWPKGDYQAYLKFYLPLDAEKIRVVSNGKDTPITLVKNKVNKKVTFKFRVPINSTKKLQLTFITPIKQTKGLSYLFFDQNQPGTKTTPYKIVVINKLGVKPKLVAPEAEIIDDRIIFTTYQDKNLLFALKF